jgi:pimeloyl-ACP methyl ester carboxylesterase
MGIYFSLGQKLGRTARAATKSSKTGTVTARTMRDSLLNQLGLDFRAPSFFFEGRQDPFSRPSLIWDYRQTITAPQKEFIWFENSSHFPFFEEQQKFSEELIERVLPLAN